jgi:hypothetical protein
LKDRIQEVVNVVLKTDQLNDEAYTKLAVDVLIELKLANPHAQCGNNENGDGYYNYQVVEHHYCSMPATPLATILRRTEQAFMQKCTQTTEYTNDQSLRNAVDKHMLNLQIRIVRDISL